MKIKRIILSLILLLLLTGCTSVNDMKLDDIVDSVMNVEKSPNRFRVGYKYFIPKGVSVIEEGLNYSILADNKNYYYIYFDLVSLNEDKESIYNFDTNVYYYKSISKNDKNGYTKIKLKENNKYLIEIVYNYAKIEVMVDESEINNTLINSINILNSIKYDLKVIKELLKDDKLNFTEETFDMFKKVKENSDILNYSEIEVTDDTENDIKDTDFLN